MEFSEKAMSVSLTTRFLLPLATFLPFTCASAAPDDGRFPIDLEQVQARSEAHFRAMDANSNGQIDLSEFESAPIPGNFGKRKGHQGAWRPHRSDGRDRNMRGRGSEGPHAKPRRAMTEAIQAELFLLMDQDSNGQLSEEEFQTLDHRARALARKRAQFKHLDTNQDGVIEQDEMSSRGQRLRQADTDGDGLVTRQEMRAARQKRMG